MILVSTKTDITANEWKVGDDVLHLREWGTDTIRILLPSPDNAWTTQWTAQWTIGRAKTCAFQLDDPTGRTSRLHSFLVRDGTKWRLCDLSKNGIKLNGTRLPEIMLTPGAEIGIGGLTLIAESDRSVQLRKFLARLLGWRSDRTEVIDRALRSVRLAATQHVALVLRGGGDLVPIARALHRRVLDGNGPFIVCDPRRRRGRATVRGAENYETGMPAFAAAAGGWLCVRGLRLPSDFKHVVAALREPNSQVRLVVCAEPSDKYEPDRTVPITVPPLASRSDEIDRIITEYAEDAIAELGTAHTSFPPADHAWVRMHSASSLPDIEKATLRLVAIRESRNLTNAAVRLGMAPVSLTRWIGRRKLPMHVTS